MCKTKKIKTEFKSDFLNLFVFLKTFGFLIIFAKKIVAKKLSRVLLDVKSDIKD